MSKQKRRWCSGLLLLLMSGVTTAAAVDQISDRTFDHGKPTVVSDLRHQPLSPNNVKCGLQLIWQHTFSPDEQQKVQSWLCQSYQSISELIGPYPFVPEVYLYRRDGANEPVPWAYTDRGGDQRIRPQQLHFYVNPSYALPQFLADWTAVHEFSHLALPLLDRADHWFAEGFASYMQVQIQQYQGYVTDPWHYYRQKLQSQLAVLKQEQPMIPLLQQLMSQRSYKAAYWGGALWFIEAQTELQARGSSWFALIQQYQQQHRLDDQDLSAVLGSFDQLLAIATQPQKNQTSANKATAMGLPQNAGGEVSQQFVLQQLWQRYQQQPASMILLQHPLWHIPEKSELDQ